MDVLARCVLAGRRVTVAVTDRHDGDIHPDRVDPEVLRRRQYAITARPWVMLDEVHGTEVVTLDPDTDPGVDPDADPGVDPDADASGRGWPLAGRGDVLVAGRTDEVLAIWVADCAPIALVGADGATLVMVHAGWRGIANGVIDVAVDALEAAGTRVALAVLGPCIHPCCYEFGAADARLVATGVGARLGEIEATTAWGTVALDVPAAVRSGLERRGIALDVTGPCTGCDQRYYSHRRRTDAGRHALLSWFEEPS